MNEAEMTCWQPYRGEPLEQLTREHIELLKQSGSMQTTERGIEVRTPTRCSVRLNDKSGFGRVEFMGRAMPNCVSAEVIKEGMITRVVLEFEGKWSEQTQCNLPVAP